MPTLQGSRHAEHAETFLVGLDVGDGRVSPGDRLCLDTLDKIAVHPVRVGCDGHQGRQSECDRPVCTQQKSRNGPREQGDDGGNAESSQCQRPFRDLLAGDVGNRGLVHEPSPHRIRQAGSQTTHGKARRDAPSPDPHTALDGIPPGIGESFRPRDRKTAYRFGGHHQKRHGEPEQHHARGPEILDAGNEIVKQPEDRRMGREAVQHGQQADAPPQPLPTAFPEREQAQQAEEPHRRPGGFRVQLERIASPVSFIESPEFG